jgi:hypothetical protein
VVKYLISTGRYYKKKAPEEAFVKQKTKRISKAIAGTFKMLQMYFRRFDFFQVFSRFFEKIKGYSR